MTGTLYLIPTTLGFEHEVPGDPLRHVIPERVRAVTAGLGYFIAENAKTARMHLKLISTAHPLSRPLQEIHIAELNINTQEEALPALLQPILGGQDGGLISEAGVPAVADPGANLVRLAHFRGIPVRPMVGPSSLLLAIMASGMNGQSFAFNGYLPTDAAQRSKRLKLLEERSKVEKQTQLFIETPYRNKSLLDAMLAICKSSTLLCVATDLSLATETVKMQTCQQWKADLALGNAPDFNKKPTVFLLLAS